MTSEDTPTLSFIKKNSLIKSIIFNFVIWSYFINKTIINVIIEPGKVKNVLEIIPKRFTVEDWVHGFNVGRVDVFDRVCEGDGILQSTDALFIGEINLNFLYNKFE